MLSIDTLDVSTFSSYSSSFSFFLAIHNFRERENLFFLFRES